MQAAPQRRPEATGPGRAPAPPPAPRSAARTLLFAYGTLMRGYGLHRVLARASTFVGDGRVRGRLLDLGAYPGLVDGRGVVTGEVYRLDDLEVLPVLDREEGYNFERRRATVTLADGRRARAWLYRYHGPRQQAVPIAGGDFRQARPPGDRQ